MGLVLPRVLIGLTSMCFPNHLDIHSQVLKSAHSMMQELASASGSPYNYKNKCMLLEAEMFSSRFEDTKARQAYTESIQASINSGFIHEQGLAEELFGKHCLRFGDRHGALQYFRQALQCYKLWGCQLKVDSIQNAIDKMDSN